MKRRTWLILAVLLVVIVVGWIVMARRNGNATIVDVGRVAKRDVFRSYVTASGEIVATRFADIGSSVMGKIVALNVAEGDRVRAITIQPTTMTTSRTARINQVRRFIALSSCNPSALSGIPERPPRPAARAGSSLGVLC
jgi:uncharacterized secreted protein with C-terminal beta-propeller domain